MTDCPTATDHEWHPVWHPDQDLVFERCDRCGWRRDWRPPAAQEATELLLMQSMQAAHHAADLKEEQRRYQMAADVLFTLYVQMLEMGEVVR